MEYGDVTLDELGARLAALESVSLRLAVVKEGDIWRPWKLVAYVYPEASNPPWASLSYDRAAFVSGEVSGAVLTDWLRGRHGGLSGYHFELGSCGSFHWVRHPSNITYEVSTVSWPHTRYVFGSTSGIPLPTGLLVSNNAPFFPDFSSAVLDLLYDVGGRPHTSQLPPSLVEIFWAHSEAWIESVHLEASTATIRVSGSCVDGSRLEISGPNGLRRDTRVDRATDCVFELPGGLPIGSWIVLSRDSKWLDYVYIPAEPWSAFSPKPHNVTTVVDRRTQIEALIYQGEGPNVEFKLDPSDDRKRLLKTVAAFANGNGGVILCGIEDKSLRIAGIQRTPDEMQCMLIGWIRSDVIPQPSYRFETCSIDGKDILALHVNKGAEPPYALSAQGPKYYVRRGASTPEAKPEEIRGCVLASQPSSVDAFGNLLR